MTTTSQVPELPTSVQRLVDRLVGRCAPDRVVLFGSATTSAAHAASDVDILIVASCQREADELTRRRTQLTARLVPRVDLVVSSREEVEQAQGERGAFLRSVLTHGTTLYSRPPST